LTVREAARELGVNLSTCYRWRKLYEIDRRVSALLPKQDGRPVGASLIDQKVEEVIDDNIRSFYLIRERPPLKELLLRIHADCDAAGLPRPIWRTLKRRIDRLNARLVVSTREGANAASAEFVIGEYRAEAPLDVVQIDHTVVDIIVVDELGYVPFTAVGSELLFEVFSQRYERGATLVTSNLPFDEWTSVFGSERLTGALLDRLTHHVHILEMNGESFRLATSKKAQRRSGQGSNATAKTTSEGDADPKI